MARYVVRVGPVVAGMARHGYDLELRRYAGAGWVPSSLAAVQAAARDALAKLEPSSEPTSRDWTITDESPA